MQAIWATTSSSRDPLIWAYIIPSALKLAPEPAVTCESSCAKRHEGFQGTTDSLSVDWQLRDLVVDLCLQ